MGSLLHYLFLRCWWGGVSDDGEKPKNTPQIFPGFQIIKSARHCGKLTIFGHNVHAGEHGVTGDQTVREPAQLKCAWTFHMSHFVQELTRKMPGTTIATHTLCEPAQSKCTWTLHKREFTSKMLQTSADQDRGPHFCASLRSWNALGHCTRSFWCNNLHVKCRGPTSGTTPGTTLCASLRSWNALRHFTKTILWKNYQEKCRGPRSRSTLCASLHTRNPLGHCTRSFLCKNLKCCGPTSGTTAGTTLCASLRSRNAFGHFTKTICARIDKKNAGDHDRDPHFARACAVEMHLDIAQTRIYK